jgi:hypothetical protein
MNRVEEINLGSVVIVATGAMRDTEYLEIPARFVQSEDQFDLLRMVDNDPPSSIRRSMSSYTHGGERFAELFRAGCYILRNPAGEIIGAYDTKEEADYKLAELCEIA